MCAKKALGVVGLLSLVMVLLAGCGGSGGGAFGTTGALQVGLTDKQSDDFQQVVVTIKEVRLVPAGLENASDTDSRLPVVATYSPSRSVDILTLRFQQELLGTVTIPAGNYSQVRLVLEPNPNGQGREPLNYLTLKTAPAVKLPLTTPSGQQSGLKVLGKFEVKPGVINAIMLDFDPNTAIVPRGNGDYNLKPTGIRIIQQSSPLVTFGSLSGTVISTFKDWSSAAVSVVPQGSSASIASGVIFSNFSSQRWQAPFSAFVPGGNYKVHIQARGFATYSSALRTVTVGADTAIGDALLLPLQ